MAAEPCNDYRLDMTAARFDTCKCGFAKTEHCIRNDGFRPPKSLKPVKSPSEETSGANREAAGGLSVAERAKALATIPMGSPSEPPQRRATPVKASQENSGDGASVAERAKCLAGLKLASPSNPLPARTGPLPGKAQAAESPHLGRAKSHESLKHSDDPLKALDSEISFPTFSRARAPGRPRSTSLAAQ